MKDTGFSTQELFKKMLEDKNFANNYILSFLDRFAYASADLEDFNYERRKKEIASLLIAFQYFMTEVAIDDTENAKISPYDIEKVGNIINRENGLEGFRKINVSAGNLATWTPVPPKNIRFSIYTLLDNYYNIWNERNIYEKEAAFHINLMRIHPFEDGNKRTSRLILNANLIKQNIPPVLISEEETKLYYDYLNNQDVKGLALFFKNKSLQELNTMISFYKAMHNIPITDSIEDIIPRDNISKESKLK